MGVHLCCGNTSVTEDLLDRSEVRPTLHHMSRSRVPEHMGRQLVGGDPGLLPIAFHDFPHSLPCERPAPRVEEKPAWICSTLAQVHPRREVVTDGCDGVAAKRNHPLATALAGDGRRPVLQVDVEYVDSNCLADPGARAVQELEQGPVTHAKRCLPIGCVEQAKDLVDRQSLRQGGAPTGGVDEDGRIIRVFPRPDTTTGPLPGSERAGGSGCAPATTSGR